jgi:hypothetical protein
MFMFPVVIPVSFAGGYCFGAIAWLVGNGSGGLAAWFLNDWPVVFLVSIQGNPVFRFPVVVL